MKRKKKDPMLSVSNAKVFYLRKFVTAQVTKAICHEPIQQKKGQYLFIVLTTQTTNLLAPHSSRVQ